MQGVGLLIAADPSSGKLVVLAPIQGGPADRAGMRPGDEVHLFKLSSQGCTLNFTCRMATRVGSAIIDASLLHVEDVSSFPEQVYGRRLAEDLSYVSA